MNTKISDRNADFEIIFDKLLDFYGVSNAAELAIKMKTTQQTISSWKTRNSIGAIKKKCRELGVYNEIFRGTDTLPAVSNKEEIVFKQAESSKEHELYKNLFGSAYMFAKENNKLEELKTLLKNFI